MLPVTRIEDLDHESTAKLVIDLFHRIIIHYALWFTEVRHQMGMDKALDTLKTAFDHSYGIQMSRLGKVLGFEMKENIPAPLLNMSQESLMTLMDSVAVNWLANDGIWFQAVEFESGMNDAKRCNDSCWAHFSPFEAKSIKHFLNLSDSPGLSGLKAALNFRLYARINTQSFIEESENSFISQMNAGFSPPENTKAFRITPANPGVWWNIPILPVPSIPGLKPNASVARRMTIRIPGIAPGGFQFEMRSPLRRMTGWCRSSSSRKTSWQQCPSSSG